MNTEQSRLVSWLTQVGWRLGDETICAAEGTVNTVDVIMEEAADMIEELAEALEWARAEDRKLREYYVPAEALESLIKELEQVTRERDAAIHDINDTLQHFQGRCFICKYYEDMANARPNMCPHHNRTGCAGLWRGLCVGHGGNTHETL